MLYSCLVDHTTVPKKIPGGTRAGNTAGRLLREERFQACLDCRESHFLGKGNKETKQRERERQRWGKFLY